MSHDNLKKCIGYTNDIPCPWYANYLVNSKYLCTHHTNVKYGFNSSHNKKLKCSQCNTIAAYCVKSFFFKSYYCISCFKRKYRYNTLYVKISPQNITITIKKKKK